MFKNRYQVIALAIVLAVAAAAVIWMVRGPRGATAYDLIAMLGDAQKRTQWSQPGDPPFSVGEVGLAGETRRAIFAPPPSRITWRIEVPRRGRLEVAFGLGLDAWNADGNGAQFRVGVSDGRTYEEYLREVVNPRERERDRRWFTATVDLSAYEGQTVDIILNTDPGPPGTGDVRSDFAYWGTPAILSR
ncbi:MAG: hypothetical protein AB1806_03915 [Acidobacteriota bacterium]